MNDAVAAVLVPAGDQLVRCGSMSYQLPPDERCAVSSGTKKGER